MFVGVEYNLCKWDKVTARQNLCESFQAVVGSSLATCCPSFTTVLFLNDLASE
jgi:hypothetical protein